MINRRSFLLFLPLGLALARGQMAHAGVTGSGGNAGSSGSSGGRGGGGNPGGGSGGGGGNSGGGGGGSGGDGPGGRGDREDLIPSSTPDTSSIGSATPETHTETASLSRSSDAATRSLASDTDRILAAVERGDAMPLSDIVAAVRKRYRGKILRIRLRGRPDALQYRIRVLSPDKRLIDIQVNARTAQIIADTEG